jgi:hypothetical protein
MTDAQLGTFLFALPFLALALVFGVANIAQIYRPEDAKRVRVRAKKRT